MRVCIFSDIHGNQYALRAFMDMVSNLNIDQFIFCGDIFGYYYGHAEAMETMAALHNLLWVIGNHDKNFIDAVDGNIEVASLIEKYGNSYKIAMSHTDSMIYADILRNMRPYVELIVCNTRIAVVHGTMSDPLNGRIYPNDVDTQIELTDIDVCIMGHTHFRLCERIGNTLYINPGSLGQPRDKKKGSFAILSLPNRSVEFHDVCYDTSLLDAKIQRYDTGNKKLLEILHRSD